MDRLIKLDKQLMELDSTNKYERNEEKVLDIIDLMKKLITKLREKGVNEKNTGRLNEIAKHIRYNNNNNNAIDEFYLDQAEARAKAKAGVRSKANVGWQHEVCVENQEREFIKRIRMFD